MKRAHTVRISEGDITPIDIAIDFPLEIGKPMFFTLEQDIDQSLVVTIKMMEEMLETMKQMEKEWRK
jgi:hypothetical protein